MSILPVSSRSFQQPMGISNGYLIGLKCTNFYQMLFLVTVWHCTSSEQVLGGTTPMHLTLPKHVLHHCSLDWECHFIWKRSLEIQYCELNVRQNCWIFWRITIPIVFQDRKGWRFCAWKFQSKRQAAVAIGPTKWARLDQGMQECGENGKSNKKEIACFYFNCIVTHV